MFKRRLRALPDETDHYDVLTDLDWDVLNSASLLVTGSTLVLEGGQPVPLDPRCEVCDKGVYGESIPRFAYNARYPRTIVGILPDSNTVLLVVTDSIKHVTGLTMDEMTTVMQSLGATAAVSLDGGGSSEMWDAVSGVLNRPSNPGNAERPIANALGVNCLN